MRKSIINLDHENKSMKKLLLPVLVTSLSFSMLSCAASFDCAKAASNTEKMICNNDVLSMLDETLSVSYKQSMEKAQNKEALQKEQLSWLKRQRSCKDSICLKEIYELRIKELVNGPSSSSENEKKSRKNHFKLHGEKLPICQSALDYLNNWQAENSDFDPKSVGIDFYSAGEVSPILKLPSKIIAAPIGLLDFDNDGVLDNVFGYSNAGSYIHGSIVYVIYGINDEKYSNSSEVNLNNIHIYPCELDIKSPKSDACPPISQKNDDATVDVFIADSPKIKFSSRYTDIKIFSYEKNTYLLLKGLNIDTKGYWAVIKPTSSSKFESKCIFEKI